MPQVHCPQSVHASLQVAIDGATVGEGFIHQILLIPLFALFGENVQTAGEMKNNVALAEVASGTEFVASTCSMQCVCV